MSRLIITLPQFSDVFDGKKMRDLVRQVELTFAKIKTDNRSAETLVTGDHTLTGNDTLLLVDTSVTSIAITLPVVQSWMVSDRFCVAIKKTADANRVTITPSGSDTIDGHTDVIVYVKNTTLDLRAVSTGWVIV